MDTCAANGLRPHAPRTTVQKRAVIRTISIALQLGLILFVWGTLAADDDPRNIAGYDKTVWGMSEDEVLAAEAPRAEKLANPSRMANGDTVSIVIKGLEIERIQFSAYFIFDSQNRKLIGVGLQSAADIGADVGSTLSRIENFLTEQYGQPSDKNDENVLWNLPKTTIELVGVDLNLPMLSTAPVRMILISYRSRLSA
jgi:hypothetical protein